MVGVQMLGAYGSLEVFFVHQCNIRLRPEERLRLQAVHCPDQDGGCGGRCGWLLEEVHLGFHFWHGDMDNVLPCCVCVLGCLYRCLSPSSFKTHSFVPLLLVLSIGTQQMFAKLDGIDVLALIRRLKASPRFQISNK